MIDPKELRERAASYRLGGPSAEHTAVMLDKAADEIERLRNAIISAVAHNETDIARDAINWRRWETTYERRNA